MGAFLIIESGSAAGDFGCGQGGETGASPKFFIPSGSSPLSPFAPVQILWLRRQPRCALPDRPFRENRAALNFQTGS
jgi:hypothetical protein